MDWSLLQSKQIKEIKLTWWCSHYLASGTVFLFKRLFLMFVIVDKFCLFISDHLHLPSQAYFVLQAKGQKCPSAFV
jgi:hypothetical protein